MSRSTEQLTAAWSLSSLNLVRAGCAGAVAGLVDLFAACLINGASPVRITQNIAGGLLGPRTFTTSYAPALGLGLQVGMGVLIAVLFLLALNRIGGRLARPVLVIGGGAVTFLVMNFVVLPLSAWHHVPHFSVVRALLNLLAMCVFSAIIIYGINGLRAYTFKSARD